MTIINSSVAVVNGKPVDKVYVNDKIVYSRNYLINKTSTPGYISGNYVFPDNVNGMVYDAIPTKAGDKWTVTQWVDIPWEYPDDDTTHFRSVYYFFLDKDGNWVDAPDSSLFIYPSNLSYFTGGIETPDNDAIAFLRVSIDWMEDNRGHAKLEKGTHATDWSPAVEDVI